jgi:predicted transposase YbfD/YdcC
LRSKREEVDWKKKRKNEQKNRVNETLQRTKRSAHWAIENNLHWSLDVTFREDFNRTRTAFAAENLALFRRLVLLLLKRETSLKASLQTKRLRAGWNNDYLLRFLNA